MNKKEKNTNKIILGLILLIIILVATTYAWFTQNKNVQITGMDVKVQTVGNLEISADGDNWSYTLDKADFQGKNTEDNIQNYLSEEFIPVSTAGGAANGKLSMFKGIVNRTENEEYSIKTEAVNNGAGYVAFDLFFKTGVPQTLYFSANTAVTSEGGIGAEKAARIAVMKIDDAETSEAIKATKYSNGGTKIFEPNAASHIDTNTYGSSVLVYAGVNRAMSNQQICYTEPVGGWPAYLTEMSGIEGVGGSKTEILDLEAGVTKVRVVLWLEGQDVDCIDNIGGEDLKFELLFTSEEIHN